MHWSMNGQKLQLICTDRSKLKGSNFRGSSFMLRMYWSKVRALLILLIFICNSIDSDAYALDKMINCSDDDYEIDYLHIYLIQRCDISVFMRNIGAFWIPFILYRVLKHTAICIYCTIDWFAFDYQYSLKACLNTLLIWQVWNISFLGSIPEAFAHNRTQSSTGGLLHCSNRNCWASWKVGFGQSCGRGTRASEESSTDCWSHDQEQSRPRADVQSSNKRWIQTRSCWWTCSGEGKHMPFSLCYYLTIVLDDIINICILFSVASKY